MGDRANLSLDDFDAVYATFYQDVFRTTRSIVLDEALAEDVTQEVFLKAYRSRDSYKPVSTIGAWLHTIAVRRALSKLRWMKLQQRVLNAVGPIRQEIVDPDPRNDVAALLAAASPKTRAAIALHYYHGYLYREIAQMLGIPEGTVATRISNGLKQIRKVIEENSEERVYASR
jgi:RNA polymerase sigma-70 factor (ECF subfamily)